MSLSVLTRAKRAFVNVLLTTASFFGLPLTVTRDSDDQALVSAYRRVAKKAHPDKGGTSKRSRSCRVQKTLGMQLALLRNLLGDVPKSRLPNKRYKQLSLRVLVASFVCAEWWFS